VPILSCVSVHTHHHEPVAGDASQGNQRRLILALTLAATYMVAEAVGGWWTGSLAVMADAGHMLSDVFALAMSVVAIRISQFPATSRHTYGYRRTEILAALGHGVLLVGIALYIFVEAFERVGRVVVVDGGPMLAIAVGGLGVNLAGLAILHTGRRDNLNVRGAWLHVLSDALGSVGAIAAALAITLFGWHWADALASIVIAVMVISSSWFLMREALDVLMEGVPAHLDVAEVRAALLELPGAIDVHDLHIWTVGSGWVSLSGHIVAKAGVLQSGLLREASQLLSRRFRIEHATLQIEPPDFEEAGTICPE
jgi:cobalt-zinc-cadmium efflux system protein